TAQALEITILYRIFEFWLPLFLGILAFAAKGRELFFRLSPAILIFLLGLVNILSALTPPIRQRMQLLTHYIPVDTTQASNMLVLLMGVLLLVTAVFLVQGLRNAWLIALIISGLSCISHLTKALDWEEASLSLFVTLVLIFTFKQYRLRINSKLMNLGIVTALSVFGGVLVFGTIAYYFLQKRHFDIDFTWKQSIEYSIKSFFLLNNNELHPVTRFGKEFLMFMHVLAIVTWVFFFYTFIRPVIQKSSSDAADYDQAQQILSQFGNSAVDYFKVYDDKEIFFSEEEEGFISYRVAGGFAIVLEEPVCSEGNKIPILEAFNAHCQKLGLKIAFYRVDEDSMYYFELLKMKKLLIGQEAVMSISDFSLEGKDKKSLRNGLNSLSKKGYSTHLFKAPLSTDLMEELKAVSDEWLSSYEKKEVVFSQGLFHRKFIKKNDIIGIRDFDDKLVAFLNIIPDYAPEECTYDLIRKTRDAPGGCMDALIVELAKYGKDHGFQYINLGLVPMAGIVNPESAAERVVKFAYEKIKRFQHYQGLHDFKSKYASQWQNKYLVYQNDFDLVQLPGALSRVMQPPQKNYVA
ncbi:MAG: phosphatidylglycerol lysyltransferase domain-containing protein, partial [Chitinophagaceae bacterium]